MQEPRSDTQDLVLATAGIVLAGAAAGLPQGGAAAAAGGVALPLIVAGVVATTVPALYIGAAYLGVAPSAAAIAGAVRAGVRSGGLYALGLAPAMLFLLSTATGATMRAMVPGLVTYAGAVAGLAAMSRALELHERRRFGRLFAAWAILALSIGAALYARHAPLP